MDIDDFRSILESSGVDVWTLIDTAILVASLDYGAELKQRRDKIVERLYSTGTGTGTGTGTWRRCTDLHNGVVGVGERNTDGHDFKVCTRKGSRSHDEGKGRVGGSPSTPPMSSHGDDDDNENEESNDGLDPYAGLFDDEQKKVLEIKHLLEDPDQTEDSLVDLLQNLADTDITFQELKETDIGRHVNRLRKHTSNDVRRLVKQLVRKWKEIVDEWVRLNPHGEHAPSALMADGDSPQQKIPQNVHNQVPDFSYSPNPKNGSSGSDKNNSEPERKPKPVPRRETPARHVQQSVSIADSASRSIQRQGEQQKESNFGFEKLASARKRLQENYKEAENAKNKRTIQMMDIHEIPKAKNAFFAKNKGGGSKGRQW